MWTEARRPEKPLLIAVFGAALCSTASFAAIGEDCTTNVDRAALQAVNKTLPIGQTTVFGSPFAIKPDVWRVEVEVFGPETLVYSVDATVDRACRVLATSARLESRPENSR